MGKLHVRFQYVQTGAALSISVERISDGFQYSFLDKRFLGVVPDAEALLPLVERTPANYHGLVRYQKVYCLDLPIDGTTWVDGDYMVTVHAADMTVLHVFNAVIVNGDDAILSVNPTLSFHATLLLA